MLRMHRSEVFCWQGEGLKTFMYLQLLLSVSGRSQEPGETDPHKRGAGACDLALRLPPSGTSLRPLQACLTRKGRVMLVLVLHTSSSALHPLAFMCICGKDLVRPRRPPEGRGALSTSLIIWGLRDRFATVNLDFEYKHNYKEKNHLFAHDPKITTVSKLICGLQVSKK